MFELSAFAGHRGHSNRVAVANRAPLPELNLALPPFCCRDSRCLTDGSLGSGRGTTAKKTLEAPASVFFPSKNCPPPPPHTLSDTSCRSHVLGRPGTHLLRRVRALALVKTPARAVLAISHTTKTSKRIRSELSHLFSCGAIPCSTTTACHTGVTMTCPRRFRSISSPASPFPAT